MIEAYANDNDDKQGCERQFPLLPNAASALLPGAAVVVIALFGHRVRFTPFTGY